MIDVKKIVCFFVLIAAATTDVSAQVRVSAQVDTGKDIYVGESFGYYIVLEGAEQGWG